MNHPKGAASLEPDFSTLIVSARAGDAKARAVLVTRSIGRIRGLIFRLTNSQADLDDLVQDTFVQAFGSLSRIQHPDAWHSWLAQIAVNVVRLYLRRRRLLRRLGLLHVTSLESIQEAIPGTTPPPAREGRELRRVLEGLPERPRMVLIMRHVEGYQLDEIATLMRTSRSSVKRWLFAAEEKVRQAPQLQSLLVTSAPSPGTTR